MRPRDNSENNILEKGLDFSFNFELGKMDIFDQVPKKKMSRIKQYYFPLLHSKNQQIDEKSEFRQFLNYKKLETFKDH